MYLKENIAEAIGVFFLVVMGCGSIMLTGMFPDTTSELMIPLTFGAIIAILVFATDHISGAHFNPAVTVAFMFLRKMSVKKGVTYIAAQLVGCLVGIGFLMVLFPDSPTYGATLPKSGIIQSLVWEIFLTFLLMYVIMGVCSTNQKSNKFGALYIGGTVFLDALWGGPLTGASMNPFRSLAPALAEGQLDTLWIYFVAPVVGTIAAAIVYNLIDTKKMEINKIDMPINIEETEKKYVNN